MNTCKRVCSLLLSLVLVLSCAVGAIPVQAAEATGNSYYVSTTGDDANNGSLEAPFRTIQKATEVMKPGDTCYVRGGVYHEKIAPAVNGTKDKPITITNYNNEEVVLSGCKQITGWSKDENKEGVWKAPMPWSLGEDGYENQVFANGKLMWEARYPNIQDGDTMTNFTRGQTKNGTGFVDKTKEKSKLVDTDLKEKFPSADTFDGATIWDVPGHGWTALTSKVESYDPATGTLVYPSTLRGKNKTFYQPKSGTTYFVFGSYGLLDAENEWWYNKGTKELYLKTPGGANPDEANIYVEAKEYSNVLDLSGCSYINVKGIDVRGSSVVTDANSSHILLQNMNMEYVGHNASLVINSLTSNACVQDDLGVLLKGHHITVDSCEIAYSSGPLINVQGSDNTVTNCYIHDGNYIGSYCGHTKLSGRRQLISNNTMTDSGRDTVSFRDLQESVVQYNDISGSARLTKDVGIMYSANTDGQNTMIHHNYIHDSFNPTTNNDNGLYTDEMTHNFIIFNNVIWRAKSNAICANQPSLYNLFYNNTGFNKASVGDTYHASFADSTGRQYINNHFERKPDNQYDFRGTWYLNNKTSGNAGFANAEGGKFMIGNDSALAGAGIAVSGVTGKNPSIGAYEAGQPEFVVGHNFEKPPVIQAPPAVTDFEFRNLIKNGGFEYGTLEGWSGEGEVRFEDSWHSTNKTSATCVYGLVMQPNQTITQKVAVKPGTTYVLALNSRSNSGSKVKFGVTGLAAGDVLNVQDNQSAKWSADTKDYLEFTTGAKDTEVTVSITNAGQNEMFVDDIGLQKKVNFISELSVPVNCTYDKAAKEATVAFEALPEGHKYFYSDSAEADHSIKLGALQMAAPEAYKNELTSGMKIQKNSLDYLNVVEVVGGNVVGFGAIRVCGSDVITVKKVAVQDGFTRGGKYADEVQNAIGNPDEVEDDANTKYQIQLNVSSSEDYTRNGYVQFDLKDLDPKLIKSAKLQVYVYKTNISTEERKMAVSGVTDENWNEDTLTWNNAPASSESLGLTEGFGLLTSPDGKFLTLDITDYTIQKAEAGDKMSLMLKPDKIIVKGNFYIATKENPKYEAAVYAPQLIVECYESPEVEAAREALQNLYNECLELKQEDYTENTWPAFADAMQAAKKTLEQDHAPKAELETAYKNLLDAKNALVEAHKHTMEHHEAKAATCTEAGNREYWACTSCGKLYADQNGITETTLEEVTIKAIGHSFGEWEQTKAPTCTDDGEEIRTCACGETQTRKIPALGHKLEKVEAKEATETTTGNIAFYICTECGKFFSDAEGKNEIAKESVLIDKITPETEPSEKPDVKPDAKPDPNGPAQTGDNFGFVLMGTVMVLALAGIAATAIVSIRRKRQ